MARKTFNAIDVENAVAGHIASAQIFSQNGIRLYIKTSVQPRRSWFEVEVIHEDNRVEVFGSLSAALEFAEENQKV